MIRGRPVGAAVLVLALAACSGPAATASRGATSPSSAGVATTEPTQSAEALSPFPTHAFADLRDEAFDAETASLLQSSLDAAAGGDGVTSTVMTADGTWTGATGSADGVHPMRPEAQMAIGSITKTVVAAQVMRLVQAGRL